MHTITLLHTWMKATHLSTGDKSKGLPFRMLFNIHCDHSCRYKVEIAPYNLYVTLLTILIPYARSCWAPIQCLHFHPSYTLLSQIRCTYCNGDATPEACQNQGSAISRNYGGQGPADECWYHLGTRQRYRRYYLNNVSMSLPVSVPQWMSILMTTSAIVVVF